MAKQSKAYAQLLALKQQELARVERQVSSSRQAWQNESQTLETLLSYQQDYRSLNQTQWQDTDSLSTLQRLKNGSRFTANLSQAIAQQQKKTQQREQSYQKTLNQWKSKSQLKQKLEDIIEEKRLAMIVDQERRLEQLESETRINLDAFGLD